MGVRSAILACLLGTWVVGASGASAAATVVRDGLPPTVAPLAGDAGSARTAHVAVAAPGTTVPVGTFPTGVAATNSTAYVANAQSNSVSVVDLATHMVSGTVPVGTFPAAVALNSSGTQVYVANFKGGTLSIIDTSTNTVSHTVTVGTDPEGVVEHGGTVYVANLLSGTISLVNPSSGTVTSTITLPGTNPAPSELAVSSDGQRLYVDDTRNGTTDVIDLSAVPPSSSGTVAVGTYPSYLAIDGTTGYVANATQDPVAPGSVSVLNLSDKTNPTVTTTINVGSHPYGIAVAPGRREVLVSNSGDNTLQAINTSTDQVVDTIPVGNTPDAVAITPDQTTAIVTNEGDNTITILHVNLPPTAGNVNFSGAIGNTAFGVGTTPPSPSTDTAGTVLANSSDPNGDTITAVPGTITSTDGGTVNMNADGTFTYEPPAGVTGNDTFTFQVSDGTDTSSGTATVTIAHMVWYVRNNDTGSNDGRSTSPFHTLAQAHNASSSGDTIYVYKGDGTTTGQNSGITLKSNQTLVGAADDLVVGGEGLLAGNSANRPDIGNSSGSGVTVNSGNTVEGLDIAASGSGAAIDGGSGDSGGAISDNVVSGAGGAGGIILSGSSGEFDISGLSDTVTGSGPGLQDNSAGTITVTGTTNTLSTQTGDALDVENTTIGASGATFQSISSNGATHGIDLSESGSGGLTVTGTGAASGSGGTIQNSTGNNVAVSSTGTYTFSSQTTDDSGPVSLSNMNIETPTASGVTSNNNVTVTNATGLTLIDDSFLGSGSTAAPNTFPTGGVSYRLVGPADPKDGNHTTLTEAPGTFDIANNTFNHISGEPLTIETVTTAQVNGNITGNTLGTSDNKASSNGGGMYFEHDGNLAQVNVTGNFIYGTRQQNGIDVHTEPGNFGDHVLNEADPSDPKDTTITNSHLDLTMTGNTIDDESGADDDAVNLASSGVGQATNANAGDFPSTVCLTLTGNNFKSTGTESGGNSVLADATGAYLHNDYDNTTFEIAHLPASENEGANNIEPGVEDYINGANTLAGAHPGAADESFVEQFGAAGFTTVGSCPQAAAPQLKQAAAITETLSAPATPPATHSGTSITHATAHKAKKVTHKKLSEAAKRKAAQRKAAQRRRAQLEARKRAHQRQLAKRRRTAAKHAHRRHTKRRHRR